MNVIKCWIKKRIDERDIELGVFGLFFIFMAVYYFFRMVKLAPWYDELYTYFYFIGNGPVYSAIHWPVPNNHIGYSVLSGFVYLIIKNPYIALRGISYLAALANLILIFVIGRYTFKKGFALALSVFYAGMWLVNNLAVQGRGYTLATTMMLICIYCIVLIAIKEECSLKTYIVWTVALCMGFYIVPSSLYWMLPVCLSAGIILLLLKKYRELIKLVGFSVISAVSTVLLYLTVWLAIGSNLLIKEEQAYSGLGHVKLICKHPVASAKRGIDYMLATPYIQSVEHKGYRHAFGEHWTTLLSQLYDFTSILLIAMYISVIFALVMLVSRQLFKAKKTEMPVWNEKENGLLCASVLTVVLITITPLTVYMQYKLPYFRVFSFYGFSIAFACTYILYVLFGKQKSVLTFVIPILFVVFSCTRLFSESYMSQYGDREASVCDLMKQNDLSRYNKLVLGDCDAEYMYRFIYDKKNENCEFSEADAIVLEKDVLNPEAEYNWEFYYDYSTVPHEELDKMKVVYENDNYLLYVRQ